MTNSKRKGKVGELELAHFLTEAGFPARRGQQYSGSPDSPDVVCESLEDLHIECKRIESGHGSTYKWLEQSREDSGEDQIPIVCHRKNRKKWLVTLELEDFLELYQK